MTLVANVIPFTQSDLGEALFWDERTGSVIWADVFKNRIYVWTSADVGPKHFDFDSIITSIAKRDSGGYVIATGDALQMLDQEFKVLQTVPFAHANPNVRTNDGSIDPQGNFWLGSMAYDGKANQGEVKIISPDASMKVVKTGVTISNGMDWSPEGSIFYYVDTPTKTVARFEYDASNSTLIRELQGFDVSALSGAPDGMCVDSEGNLWVAFWGGGCVRKFSASGVLLDEVAVDATLVTNCAFGGPDLSTLYITTAVPSYDASITAVEPLAGSLFCVEAGVSGRIQNNFKG